MAGLDRINGSEPIYGTEINNRRVDNKNASENGGFALPDEKDREGVIYEPSAPIEKPKTLAQTREEIAREERIKAKQNLHSRFDGPGVEVELSTQAVERAAKEGRKPETLGDIIRDVFKGIRDFFVTLWVGPDEAETEPKADLSAEAEADPEVEPGENPIADSLTYPAENLVADSVPHPVAASVAETDPLNMDNDPESIASFMSDYGGRRLAKNSDLLTQYDRSGRIISPSASDRRRILQGEGQIRRY